MKIIKFFIYASLTMIILNIILVGLNAIKGNYDLIEKTLPKSIGLIFVFIFFVFLFFLLKIVSSIMKKAKSHYMN